MQPSPTAMPTALFSPARLSVGLALPIQAEGRRDVDVPAQLALIDILHALRELGVHHVSLNLADTGRPPAEAIAQLASDVLPRIRD